MKILFVSTISNTVNTFLLPHIKLLVEQGHKVDVAFNIVQEVNQQLFEMGCSVHNIEFQRSPLNRLNYLAYIKLKKIISEEEYDVIHTHTPVASACVRYACRKNVNAKVIYTAHGFHFYSGAPLVNWLIYYPIERILAKYTDVLITINKEDFERAKEFKAREVKYIPGVGIDTTIYKDTQVNNLEKRNELNIPEDAFIVLSIGELNKNKNHETVIKAIAKLNNPNLYYLICGEGPLKKFLARLSEDLEIAKQVKLIGFRRDIPEILSMSDLFVFPSYREGLSVSLMEAMTNGIPVICSNIRGNIDLIENGKGGYLIEPNDVEGFTKYINELCKSSQTRINYGKFNQSKIEDYSIKKILIFIDNLYRNIN